MNATDIAKDFTAMLKNGHHQQAAAKYNSDAIVSYEAMEGPMAVCKGKDEVNKKSEWWYANHEVHSSTAAGPFVNGDQFVVHFAIDVTAKQSGQRMNIEEVGIYKIADGKIVEERFCYLQA